MNINEHFIQIRGKIVTDKELNLGDDLKVIVTVTDIQTKDLQDGTVDVIYKAKMFEEE